MLGAPVFVFFLGLIQYINVLKGNIVTFLLCRFFYMRCVTTWPALKNVTEPYGQHDTLTSGAEHVPEGLYVTRLLGALSRNATTVQCLVCADFSFVFHAAPSSFLTAWRRTSQAEF